MTVELIVDDCYWCESPISRPSENLLWVDDYESADCDFHPAVFDSLTLERSNDSAPHQTIGEVHTIISEYQKIRKLQRDKATRLRAVDSNTVVRSNKLQRTSRDAAEKLLPRSGSMRRKLYEWIQQSGGRTDYELERELHCSHQSISASRRSLVVDGWLVDSGQTRKNLSGNDCIVWVTSSINEGMLFANVK